MNKLSKLSENIVGNQIVKIAQEIDELKKQGDEIYNLTVGDFDPNIFPIPFLLKAYIKEGYDNNKTNYPTAEGILELREEISNLYKTYHELEYTSKEIIVASGGRPLIYNLFRTILDNNDNVIYPVPSWNNDHYTSINFCNHIPIETNSDTNFMLTAEHIKKITDTMDVSLICLCSPQNPTGTIYTKEQLTNIVNLVLEINKVKKENNLKPTYIMYDQIYGLLLNGFLKHYNPLHINPEIKEYLINIDGISKWLCGTGVRIGWATGPEYIIQKMKALSSHMGTLTPYPEQYGFAKYLKEFKTDLFDNIHYNNNKISKRLNKLYNIFKNLYLQNYPINALEPQGGIYLSVMIDIDGNGWDIYNYLLKNCKIALVPFEVFGSKENEKWFRLSVGTLKDEDIDKVKLKLETGLEKFKLKVSHS